MPQQFTVTTVDVKKTDSCAFQQALEMKLNEIAVDEVIETVAIQPVTVGDTHYARAIIVSSKARAESGHQAVGHA